MNIYDFKVKDSQKNTVSLEEYKGKILLIVNTATGCGFTPQYDGLQNLYEKYKDKGFEILDFPCNQFLNQAPGTDEEIVDFCQTKFGVTFKTFSKIDVNGKNEEPLYGFLKSETPKEFESGEASGFKKTLAGLTQNVFGTNIKWNFTKFLVDRDGKVIARYSPTHKPEAIESKIVALLEGGH
jgi:glutathione peroxidase